MTVFTTHRRASFAPAERAAALRWIWAAATLVMMACGVPGTPSGTLHKVDLGCAHDKAPCVSCHPADKPIGPLDTACSSCHTSDRPDSHIATLTVCETCHDSCDWKSVEHAHPEGFTEAAAHGVEANLQRGVNGDCRTCHGADLKGATTDKGWFAVGCDDCHTEKGHADWRTDCTFCHGGTDGDVVGAPPQDLDNSVAADALSFKAHRAHGATGDHPAWTCTTCHASQTDVLSPGHAFDVTPGVSEVDFTAGTSPAAVWDGATCSDGYCHGNGRVNGSVADGVTPMTCDSCHGTTDATTLTQIHGDHLTGDPSIHCSDCHLRVVDATNVITRPELHVDGAVQIAFADAGFTKDPGSLNCTGTCHGVSHANGQVGHPAGYDAADVHGKDANLQVSNCRSCHGADLTGGAAAPSCDDCHAAGGHPDWRTDCVYCHGGKDGDVLGAPAEDIDNTVDPEALSFKAHRTHGATGDHPAWDCATCHKVPVDVLSPDHTIDLTPGVSEVDFTASLSPTARWDGTTCADSYCHGDGQVNGTVTDSTTKLTCDGCHGMTDVAKLSEIHGQHVSPVTISCADCHAMVVDGGGGTIVAPELHVDGQIDLTFAEAGITVTPGRLDCTGTCHEVAHLDGLVGHPAGYEAANVHGVEANLQVTSCGDCHGEDLTGGVFAEGCDDCHAAEGHADWRSDCTFCHGGTDGDVDGAPPQDLDDTVDPELLSFKAHRAHGATGDHAIIECAACHVTPDDVLFEGHSVDATQGAAEVDFTQGLSPTARWDGTTCSDSYCHGDGVKSANVDDSTTELTCDGCHATADATALSTIHGDHIVVDPTITCADCHSTVVDPSNAVIGPQLHVDGALQVSLSEPDMHRTPGQMDCTGTCHTVVHDAGKVGHADGYKEGDQHGLDANNQVTDCTSCHGADLTGAKFAPGCDDCHTTEGFPGWRTDCTFCHGGLSGDTAGAPPEDIHNTVDVNALSFKAHQAHGLDGDHPPMGCDACHTVPDDVLSTDHTIDTTPGAAEVDPRASLSPTSVWNGTTCANNYCHGNGRTNGTVTDSAEALSCDGCHGTLDSTKLTTIHSDHLRTDPSITCSECHSVVVDPTNAVFTPELHVDGAVEVNFAGGTMAQTPGQLDCTGTCHGVEHKTGEVGHPAGYAEAAVHGVDANLQLSNCRTCHGADLTGGAFTPGCDTCHADHGAPDWRTDCTFCHGGLDGDVDGAPPEDIDNTVDVNALSFKAHRAHAADGDHADMDCATCHVVPTDVMSAGHTFDATAGKAEVDGHASLSPASVWNGTTCANNYCHGNGRVNGSVADSTTAMTCDSCHSTADPSTLSTVHGQHVLDATITCEDCHSVVVDAADNVFTPELHVDGAVEVSFVGADITHTAGQLNCTGACHGVKHTNGEVGHGPGYDAADVHGLDVNLQATNCTECHGADLKGGAFSPGCDSCHSDNGAPGWRADCTFCHGGVNGDTAGAPPEDINNTIDLNALSFKAHRAHGLDGGHADIACAACHTNPVDVLSIGHTIDATPGVAEVSQRNSLSSVSTWNGTTCANNYCHGNGRTNGTVTDSTTPLTCDSCHATMDTTQLTTIHSKHMLNDPTISCVECHTSVVDAAKAIRTPDLHVDGSVDVVFGNAGMSVTAGQQDCTGSCHGVQHTGGSVGHPPGYDAPEVHGVDANLQVSDCASCHGATLAGGPGAPGCDSCHSTNGHPGWRTECTFCHGGLNGDTVGAPPEDIDNTASASAVSFKAHRAHGLGGNHPDWTCATCHTQPLNVQSTGHTVDGTPGAAEVTFAGSISPSTTWSGTTCANNSCHGNGKPGATATVTDSTTPMTCNSCHATTTVTSLTSVHSDHMPIDPTITCADCHTSVVNATNVITGRARHVNGTLEVAFSVGTMTRTAGTLDCTGSCHNVSHNKGNVGHPAGYAAANRHGLDANLQRLDCKSCHGANLRGGTFGLGCDSCHTTSGNPGWRTDCTFCHGGTSGDTAGAPPEDIDNTVTIANLEFKAHRAHGTTGNNHPSYSCATCHVTNPTDVLSTNHAFDGTPGVSEVGFSASISPTTIWNGTTCANNYCHGNGRVNATASVSDGTTPMTCDSCHGTTNTAPLTSLHSAHKIADPTITCADCHQAVVSAANAITSRTLHINKTIDVKFSTATITRTAGKLDCTGSCHGVVHQVGIVGHDPGYDAADQHGLDANLQTLDCKYCHGPTLSGVGLTPGCDSCHTTSGNPGWRTDCTFCHGGTNGDTAGAPPEDIDNNTNPITLAFKAHRSHGAAGDHPPYTCDTCHVTPLNVLSVGHAFDTTAGRGEVDFSGSDSPDTVWNGTTCANNYCHGDGRSNGTATDSASLLTCDGCHGTTDAGRLSVLHPQHLLRGVGITCADCHAGMVDASNQIVTPDLHVDGFIDMDYGANLITTTPGALDCTGSCHGVQHYNGQGGHPAGYDAADVHGVDANLQFQDCRTCHGATLNGGTFAPGCDSCHTTAGAPGWRTDCTFCHGGSGGDTAGAPPEDLDNTITDTLLQFRAHRAHQDPTRHPNYACSQCHGSAANTYNNATSDLNHWFDSTAGRSEVVFSAGIAKVTTWNGTTCATNYCHGNGRTTASIADGHRTFDCNDCHADINSSSTLWGQMSGEHRRHLGTRAKCSECHFNVTNASQVILAPTKHVDGVKDVMMDPGNSITRATNGRCTGRCHGVEHDHQGDSW